MAGGCMYIDPLTGLFLLHPFSSTVEVSVSPLCYIAPIVRLFDCHSRLREEAHAC